MNYRKTWIIATREYFAAIRSKSFLISLVLMPLFMSGGLIAQKVGKKMGDSSTYTVAVIDASPDAALYSSIEQAVTHYNEHDLFDSTGKQMHGRFIVEKIAPPDAGDSAALDQQRLGLSDRVRNGQLLAFVEINSGVLDPTRAGDPDASTIRYYTNRPTYEDFLSLLRTTLPTVVIQKKFTAAGEQFQKLKPLFTPTPIVETGLFETTNGKVRHQSQSGELVSIFIPMVMILMIFLITLMGTSPIAANVVEEKQLRIAEVLLGSVTPFELMFGKLLGGAAVSLTLGIIFFSGAYYVAHSMGVAGYVSGASIVWFFFFTTVGTFMYGSLFAAAGSACTTIKEVQSFILPVMLLIALPMFLLGPMLQNPSGPLGLLLSFFPLSAPTIMVMRITIPPGVTAWQPIVAAVCTLLATVAMVWAAARIFRIGILMQGKGANYAAIVRWILRG